MFGFLGPNGSGKTTAMRAVLGLVALDGGEVRWEGARIAEHERRGFGYMPEERGLYPGMRVLDQLVFLGRLHGLEPAAAHDAALLWTDRLGIADRRDAKLESLSLGNQQRVQLAASLLHSPELLILDEPFSGLDPVAVDAFSAILAGRPPARPSSSRAISSTSSSISATRSRSSIAAGSSPRVGSRSWRARGRRASRRFAEDRGGAWARGGLPDVQHIETAADGTVSLTLSPDADAQAVLETARRAGPIEHFAFASRRLSEVFLEAVGLAEMPDDTRGCAGAPPPTHAGVGQS